MQIEVKANDINDCYKLGKKEYAPIKVELISYLKKREILSNARKLKGSYLSISHDLTEKQRKEYTILKTNLLKAKANGSQNSFIRGNRLVVGNTSYTAEELENIQPENKANSAPPTPARSEQENRVFESEEDENSEGVIWEDTETLEEAGTTQTEIEKKQNQSGKGTPKSTIPTKLLKKKSPRKHTRLRPRNGSAQQ